MPSNQASKVLISYNQNDASLIEFDVKLMENSGIFNKEVGAEELREVSDQLGFAKQERDAKQMRKAAELAKKIEKAQNPGK